LRTTINVSTIALLITLAGCGGGETATTGATSSGAGGGHGGGASTSAATTTTGTDATSAAGTGGNTSAATSTGSLNPGMQPFGAPCTNNGDCTSLLCVDIDATHAVCTKPCDTGAACPPAPEWSCAMKGGAPQTICLCQPSGEEICDGQDNNCDGVVDEGDCPELFGTASGPIADLKLASDRLVLLTDKTIETMDLVGGLPVTTLRSDIMGVAAVAVTPSSIFWIQGQLHQMGYNGVAQPDITLTKGFAPFSDIVANIAYQYYRDGAHVYRAVPSQQADAPSTGPMLLFKGVLYWGSGNTLYRCDGTTINPNIQTQIVKNLLGPAFLATDGDALYWADAGGGIHKAAPPAYTVSDILMGEPGITGLAVDTTNAYWSTSNGTTSTVWKAPLAGGAKTKIGGVTGTAHHLVVSGSYVYFDTGKVVWRSAT
jgi:hypothetical protein